MNIIDNQATKHIKASLTEQQCKLQLIEPHNHRMNTAERVIQTFKDAFIAALTTIGSKHTLAIMGQHHIASSGHTKYNVSLKEKSQQSPLMKQSTACMIGTSIPLPH
jgi:hypothetical protein